jgi:hypothetical protein
MKYLKIFFSVLLTLMAYYGVGCLTFQTYPGSEFFNPLAAASLIAASIAWAAWLIDVF